MVLFIEKGYHQGLTMSVHDDLLALCRDIHAAGEPLTYKALIARHGGGSRRDIAKALRAARQENPGDPAVALDRPSRLEAQLRDIIQHQRETITEQTAEISVLKEEIESLGRMVRKYRAYPEDFEE